MTTVNTKFTANCRFMTAINQFYRGQDIVDLSHPNTMQTALSSQERERSVHPTIIKKAERSSRKRNNK